MLAGLIALGYFVAQRLAIPSEPAVGPAASAQSEQTPLVDDPTITPATAAPAPATSNGPVPPASLQAAITALGRNFDGDIGIVVRSVNEGWIAAQGGDLNLPQQSLSKLWVAAALLDKVDASDISLDDTVTLTTADLSIFHQPIRKRILANGSYTTSIADLLRRAMTQSDNTANAALFRAVGGEAGVEAFLQKRGLPAIQMAQSEKALQMGIVGMEWQDSYSYGRNFWKSRERVPFAQRMQTMGKYLAAPPDGATPLAVAQGLTKLAKGELLSAASSAYLIDLMAKSKTGPKRLRGGLPAGWTMPHKTGTGQVLRLLATAYNDVGILKSPSGRQYAVVVMIGATNRPVKERQELMQAVTRSVIDYEETGGQ